MVAALVAAAAVAIPVLGATLPNSTFDAGDGNLVLDDNGDNTNDDVKDWENASPLNARTDLLKGQGDNALGEGTSEDDPVPNLKVDGIPPNKSDITRFYESHETVSVGGNDKVFLYLAWERITDPSGTTNFDFELNQSSTPSANGETPVRTAGDVLIKYDLSNGGTNPGLGFHRWVTSDPAGAGATCEASSKFPCWDKVHPIAGNNFQASINTTSVSDPILLGTQTDPRTLPARTFGEAAINLTDAGILPTGGSGGGCVGFASAYLKSRSSDSFNSAIKDFASPVNANINLCKPLTIKAKKVDASDNLLGGATFELYLDANKNGAIDTGETKLGTCTTTATQAGNPCTLVSNRAGSGTECFVVKETVAPNGYNLPADTEQDFCHTYSTTETTITRTFTDSPAPGTINILKQDDAGNPLAGVTFTLWTDVGGAGTDGFGPPDGNDPNDDDHTGNDTVTSMTCTTAGPPVNQGDPPAGTCKIENVPLGKYWVVEGTPPTGYDRAPDQWVEIGLGSSPGQGQTKNLTFVDPRKHRVIVLVCHEGSNTLAKSHVSRADDSDGKDTLANGVTLPDGVSEAELCGLGGASYNGLSNHQNDFDLEVDVGSSAH